MLTGLSPPLYSGVYWNDMQLRVVSGSSTPNSLTPSSLTIYALQLLIPSHKQFRGVFSLGVWGLVSQEYVLVFSV